MSIHYLIDPFTTNGDIIDVHTSESGQTEATGATVIRVPDGVAIHNNPTDLSGLLTSKYDGLLASYAGFTQIVANSCMNSGVASSKNAQISSGFVHHAMFPNGTISTTAVVLPSAPTQVVAVWEAYEFTESNDKTGRYQRFYVESDPNDFFVQVTFDGGLNYYSVAEGAVFNVPLAGQGTNFNFQFGMNPATKRYLGSWSIIF
jgi:hypothetical protein